MVFSKTPHLGADRTLSAAGEYLYCKYTLKIERTPTVSRSPSVASGCGSAWQKCAENGWDFTDLLRGNNAQVGWV